MDVISQSDDMGWSESEWEALWQLKESSELTQEDHKDALQIAIIPVNPDVISEERQRFLSAFSPGFDQKEGHSVGSFDWNLYRKVLKEKLDKRRSALGGVT